MKHILIICTLVSSLGLCPIAHAQTSQPEITLLSTMVANFTGEGEWGFSALLETPTATILFDTGFKENTVLNNAKMLKKDLSKVEIVILSHFHTDHTGGLLKLRKTHSKTNPKAFSKVYVGKGFFEQRYDKSGKSIYSLSGPRFSEQFQYAKDFKAAAETLGIQFIVVEQRTEIGAGLVLTGPIERVHDEKNVSPGFFLKQGDKLIPDNVPESQALGIQTEHGWLLLSGCGHAGIINASEQLRKIREQPIYIGVGGFHLFRANDDTVSWTATKLKSFGLQKLVGAHCTGAHATFKLAQLLNLPRKHVSIGAIGTRVDSNLNIISASIE
ncbi:MAG: MBL fold metallo-hydrolase [Pseudomonadota bacterium]